MFEKVNKTSKSTSYHLLFNPFTKHQASCSTLKSICLQRGKKMSDMYIIKVFKDHIQVFLKGSIRNIHSSCSGNKELQVTSE